MGTKYVSTHYGCILHECSYTEDATNLYKEYSDSRKGFKEFGKTHHLSRKMRKTEPRGNVFRRLVRLKIRKLEKTNGN